MRLARLSAAGSGGGLFSWPRLLVGSSSSSCTGKKSTGLALPRAFAELVAVRARGRQLHVARNFRARLSAPPVGNRRRLEELGLQRVLLSSTQAFDASKRAFSSLASLAALLLAAVAAGGSCASLLVTVCITP